MPSETESVLDLHVAAWCGNLDLLLSLLSTATSPQEAVQRASSPDHAKYGANTPLHYAVYNINSIACVDFLLRLQVPINSRNADGCTPLFLASQQGNVEAVHALMRAGADPLLCETQTGSSFSAAEVADGDAGVLVALAGGAIRSKGAVYTRPSKLRCPLIVSSQSLVYEREGSDLSDRGEAIEVRVRSFDKLRLSYDIGWASSVTRMKGADAAKAIQDITEKLKGSNNLIKEEGLHKKKMNDKKNGLDDSIMATTFNIDNEDDDDEEEDNTDNNNPSDAISRSDGEFTSMHTPSVALIPLPYASIEVGVIDVTNATNPVIAKRIILDRKSCEAASHSFVLDDLTKGHTYMVKVRAINALGCGHWSSPTLPIVVEAKKVVVQLDEDAPQSSTSSRAFSSASSSARLGQDWAEDAAVLGQRLMKHVTVPSVRLEELGATILSSDELIKIAANKAKSSLSNPENSARNLTQRAKEKLALAEAAARVAEEEARIAAAAAAKAAITPRLIGRGVLAAPPPSVIALAPPIAPRTLTRPKLPPVIYKIQPDRPTEEDDDDGDGDGDNNDNNDVKEEQGISSSQQQNKIPSSAVVNKSARPRKVANKPRKIVPKPRPPQPITFQPRKYYAPLYYEDPAARSVGAFILNLEHQERQRKIAEGDAEAIRLAREEAEAADALAAAEALAEEEAVAEEMEAERQETAAASLLTQRTNLETTITESEIALSIPQQESHQSVASISSSRSKIRDSAKRTSGSALADLLQTAAFDAKAKRGITPDFHIDLSRLQASLHGTLREYNPAILDSNRRSLEEAQLLTSLRLTTSSGTSAPRSERLTMAEKLTASVEDERKRALEEKMAQSNPKKKADPVVQQKRGSFPLSSYESKPNGPPRVADALISEFTRNRGGLSSAFTAAARGQPLRKKSSLLAPGPSAIERLQHQEKVGF